MMKALGFGTLLLAASVIHAAPTMELTSMIELPGVKGRIDHFSADVEGHRIFVAALGNDTVEVIDTRENKRRSIQGLGEPQGVLYVPGHDRLFIANGSADRVDIVDATSLLPLKHLERMPDADNVRYDAAGQKVMVGYGRGALRSLDAQTGESVADIALPGHPESFQLEQRGPRAFVNIPSTRAIMVVDRLKGRTLATWPVAEASSNFPMALDETNHRLFVGARSPSVLLVYDTETGNVVHRLPIGGHTDDVFYDPQRKRLYVVCGEGRIDIIRQDSPDRYAVESSIKTAPGARTGLFVPEDSTLYVAAPARGGSAARVLRYRIN